MNDASILMASISTFTNVFLKYLEAGSGQSNRVDWPCNLPKWYQHYVYPADINRGRINTNASTLFIYYTQHSNLSTLNTLSISIIYKYKKSSISEEKITITLTILKVTIISSSLFCMTLLLEKTITRLTFRWWISSFPLSYCIFHVNVRWSSY